MSDFVMVRSEPDHNNLKLEPIEKNLYRLTYTGFWGCTASCYVAIGPDAAVFCQSIKDSGTSITNIWDLKFILAVAALAPIGHRPLYEYYFDDDKPDISRVTYQRTNHDCVNWKYTGQSFAQIVGRPEPDWAELSQVEK